ncbi:hypothetical protein XPR_4653, partial [Xanthomonas arboricola pv. pruni MAFF 301420]
MLRLSFNGIACMPVLIRALVLLILTVSLSGCGYNAIQQKEEGVKAGWSEVLNQYQRRADLIPNLVRTVQGYAQQERQVLTEVTNARSRVGQIQVNADDEASLKQFQQAQGELGSALSRLLVVSENYPQLKSDQSFRDLQVQLEGTENRITVARGRYIQTVQEYNTYIRSFPQVITAKIFGYQPSPISAWETKRRFRAHRRWISAISRRRSSPRRSRSRSRSQCSKHMRFAQYQILRNVPQGMSKRSLGLRWQPIDRQLDQCQLSGAAHQASALGAIRHGLRATGARA